MSRFVSPVEAVQIALLGNQDYLERDKGRLLKYAKYVWQDLNDDVLRIATRVKIPLRERLRVNKGTNSVDIPCNSLKLSSVNVVDECGIEYPVFRNMNIKTDIVELDQEKDCACEYKCGYKLCNTIKSYVLTRHTETDSLPNGDPITFDCIDRKCILGNYLYEEKQYPLRVYEDSVWTNTVLHTEQTKLCEVEVDKNGCCCDTEENLNNVCNSCGFHSLNQNQCCVGGTAETPPNDSCEKWIYYCNNKMDWFQVQCGGYPFFRRDCNNVYNISELGNRLVFPHNFGWDSVVVRFYEDFPLDEIKIPVIAIDTFVTGLKWWDTRFNDKKRPLAREYKVEYAQLKFGLLKTLNRYRIEELRMIVSPPMFVPSSVEDRSRIRNSFYYNSW